MNIRPEPKYALGTWILHTFIILTALGIIVLAYPGNQELFTDWLVSHTQWTKPVVVWIIANK